jgi:formylglycine-generating enzyme required for sulfatase activity
MDFTPLLPQFIRIPSVPFLMGTPERELSALAKAYGGTRESYREESPQHTLTLPTFAIAQTSVSNAHYAAYVVATGARPPLAWRGSQPPETLRDHPVVDVNWEEAVGFCNWLTAILDFGSFDYAQDKFWILDSATGEQSKIQNLKSKIRLPTEAEWEHAARGTDGRTFPWGDTWDIARANTRERGLGATTPVGSSPDGASSYGCLDMAGNVWEWTASLDALYPYNSDDGREDLRAPGRRILRGGCYANPHGFARCVCRFRLPPTVRNEFLGFRLAFSLEVMSL